MWQKWYIPRRIMPNTLCKNLKSIGSTVKTWFTAEILEFSTWRTQGTQKCLIYFLNNFICCVHFHKSNYIQVVLKQLKIYIYCITTFKGCQKISPQTMNEFKIFCHRFPLNDNSCARHGMSQKCEKNLLGEKLS